jgi:hypothetical protein
MSELIRVEFPEDSVVGVDVLERLYLFEYGDVICSS